MHNKLSNLINLIIKLKGNLLPRVAQKT